MKKKSTQKDMSLKAIRAIAQNIDWPSNYSILQHDIDFIKNRQTFVYAQGLKLEFMKVRIVGHMHYVYLYKGQIVKARRLGSEKQSFSSIWYLK